MTANFTGKVFSTVFSTGFPDQTGYPHTMICLGEGLSTWDRVLFKYKLLAVFPGTEDYLFRHNSNVTPDDCIVVLNQDWFCVANQPFPQFLFHPARKYHRLYGQ